MIVLAALALAIAAPQAAPAAPVAALVDPARKARGIELARMLNSEALTRIQLDKMLGETMPALIATDPDFKAMEAEYPGITKAMIDAMRGILVEEVLQSLPELWDKIGTVYAEELTVADLDAVLAFFRSTSGARLAESVAREGDLSQLLKTMIADDKETVTETALRNQVRASATKAMGKLNAEDRSALINFGWSPAGVKLRTANARIMPIATAWSNRSSPQSDAKMEKAMAEVVEKFMREDDRK